MLILVVLAPYSLALIQTDIIYTMDDTYVNSSSSSTNYDGLGLIVNDSTLEIWFRFNLSDPNGYYVTQSSIYTYVNSFSETDTFEIQDDLSATWDETNLTWATKPGKSAVVDSNEISSIGWYIWGLTNDYAGKFNLGTSYVSYSIEGSKYLVIEDKEDALSTGNVPYLNLTMMIPEAYLISPANLYSTYDSTIIFQYNTTDAGNITNCSLIFDTMINMTNTSIVENSTSQFTLVGIFPGDHTWTVRCYDVNRQTYQIEPAVRDLIMLAKIEWYNPSSATQLDIGAVLITGEDASGTRQIYSNNSNNDVAISCASGDCSVITTNWSTIDVDGGGVLTAGFNCSTDSVGSFEADFELTSDQDSISDTLTVNCSVLAPDLRISSTNITFSDNSPSEGQIVTIDAGVYNDGTYTATDVVIRFYEGHYSTGTQIGTDHQMTVGPGESTIVQENWTAKVGEYDIYVVLDPPIDTNGSIVESDEFNNHNYSTMSVSLWTIFIGNVTGSLALQTEDNKTVLKWDVADTTDSLIYVTDTDCNPDFNSLVAFSRNTTGSYMSDDFTELDNIINTTNYCDSINLTYTASGSPIFSEMFTVFGISIDDVPVINSTNSSTFVSGILWDSSDDSNSNNQFDNTSKEDIVFVTRVNTSMPGLYGVYDYEIKVPANLKNYNPIDVLTVTFYTEIK